MEEIAKDGRRGGPVGFRGLVPFSKENQPAVRGGGRRGPGIPKAIVRMMDRGVNIDDLKVLLGEGAKLDLLLDLIDVRNRKDRQITWKEVLAAWRLISSLDSTDAMDRLIDRVDGKPPQRVHLGRDDEPTLPEMADDELLRIASGGETDAEAG